MNELRKERGGWIAISNNKTVHNFEFIALSSKRVERGERGGWITNSLEVGKFRPLSFDKVERKERGC